MIAFVIGVLSPCICRCENARPRPNFVFILVDDLRYDVFSHANHPFIETPNIDFLAEHGLVFRNAFVTTSLCSPSRASFLTGRYMHNHRVVDNVERMPKSTITFPQLLQDSGYLTAFIGKWHMGGSSDEPRPGFDHWVSFRGQGTYWPEKQKININGDLVDRKKYMTDELTDYATNWLSMRKGTEPFLLYLSHKGVHGLYEPAERHRDVYRHREIEWPVAIERPLNPEGGKPMWVLDQRNSWHGVEFPYYGRSQQSIEEMYRHYCEMVLSIDESVGRLLKKIEEMSFSKNTVFIFTSDGGHLWGEHGLIDKRCAYEESIRIPLLVYAPAYVSQGKALESIVSNIDVAPSLLELTGIEPPEWMDGQSFADFLTDPRQDEDQSRSLLYEYYWEPQFPQTPTTFCLRKSRFKLIQYHGIWDSDELYDIKNDPHEQTNLINHPQYQDTVSSLRRDLHEKLRDTGGLVMPLGIKRGAGSNLREREGSTRAPFPSTMLRSSGGR